MILISFVQRYSTYHRHTRYNTQAPRIGASLGVKIVLRPYLIIFKANGEVHEWFRFHESITECVDSVRKAIRSEYEDHKIEMITELSGAEFEELTGQ